MFKNKIILITLLFYASGYLIEIRQVLCSPYNRNGKTGNERNDFRSRMWGDQREDESDWPMDGDAYINVMRGRAREWTNLEHAQPLKRSDEAVGFPNPPIANDLGGLNISNPISKYHCPINLLYGNNLTVKNYFLLVPRGNASCNDNISQIQSVSDENLEMKSIPQKPQAAQGASREVLVGTIAAETTSGSKESSSETTASPPTPTVEAMTVGRTEITTPTEINATFLHEVDNKTVEVAVEMIPVASTGRKTNDVAENTTVGMNHTEVNNTFSHEVDNTTLEVIVELITGTSTMRSTDITENTSVETTTMASGVETTTAASTENSATASPNQSTSTISEDLMRTLEKYCKTFNLSGGGHTYTINPVTINLNINSLEEEKGSNFNVFRKLKRTPEEKCKKFNISRDLNYTIQPVVIPQDSIKLETKENLNFKKKKRNLDKNKRVTKQFKSLR